MLIKNQAHKLQKGGEDRFVWHDCDDGQYKIKSGYRVVSNNDHGVDIPLFSLNLERGWL